MKNYATTLNTLYLDTREKIENICIYVCFACVLRCGVLSVVSVKMEVDEMANYRTFGELKEAFENHCACAISKIKQGENVNWYNYKIENSVNCECAYTEPVLWETSNGHSRVSLQCTACGNWNNTGIRKSDYDLTKLKFRNDALLEKYRHLDTLLGGHILKAYRERIDNEQNRWWQNYDKYMKSDLWQKKREAVMKRDNYLCQACLCRPAKQVHHLTYKHFENEPLFELVAVCKTCHDKITELDRNGR